VAVCVIIEEGGVTALLSVFRFSYVKYGFDGALAKFKYFMIPMTCNRRRTNHNADGKGEERCKDLIGWRGK